MFDGADSLGDDPLAGRVGSPSFAAAAAGGEGHSDGPPSQLGHWSEFGPDDPFAVFTDGGDIALPISGDTSSKKPVGSADELPEPQGQQPAAAAPTAGKTGFSAATTRPGPRGGPGRAGGRATWGGRGALARRGAAHAHRARQPAGAADSNIVLLEARPRPMGASGLPAGAQYLPPAPQPGPAPANGGPQEVGMAAAFAAPRPQQPPARSSAVQDCAPPDALPPGGQEAWPQSDSTIKRSATAVEPLPLTSPWPSPRGISRSSVGLAALQKGAQQPPQQPPQQQQQQQQHHQHHHHHQQQPPTEKEFQAALAKVQAGLPSDLTAALEPMTALIASARLPRRPPRIADPLTQPQVFRELVGDTATKRRYSRDQAQKQDTYKHSKLHRRSLLGPSKH